MLMDQIDTLHVGRYWSDHGLENYVLNFISLYVLNMMVYKIDTLHVCRYWSEVLCCTIRTHLSDLEVKVMRHGF